jgi:hypothetical protein
MEVPSLPQFGLDNPTNNAFFTNHGSRTSVQAGTGSKMLENINSIAAAHNQQNDKSAD